MRLHRCARLLTGWIAGLALLFAALAPTLAQAFGGHAAATWVEVCTAQGPARVSVDPGADADGAAPAHPFEHCTFCSFQANGPALPPAAPTLALLGGTERLVPACLAAPRTPPAWVSAQPRAPPPLS
ncbi:DUF2946 family protein [Piscinibacter defluvii]|uniref:DUF2946 family protein n=1 Tax=Piscinibacter defluvii TaxID=1796922 RepID=UPI000FDDDB22|nr:DUF2946 family protein [Piscinibacter defluvii]